MVDSNFRTKIESLMAEVPYGQVTTYGDLAALAGHAHASRVVGGVAHCVHHLAAQTRAGPSLVEPDSCPFVFDFCA